MVEQGLKKPCEVFQSKNSLGGFQLGSIEWDQGFMASLLSQRWADGSILIIRHQRIFTTAAVLLMVYLFGGDKNL